MTDDTHVTIKQVYEIVGQLREEIRKDNADMREQFAQGLSRLESAIIGMRSDFVLQPTCDAMHSAQEAALEAHSRASGEDRKQIHAALKTVNDDLNELKKLVYKYVGAAAVIVFVISTIASVIISHLTA